MGPIILNNYQYLVITIKGQTLYYLSESLQIVISIFQRWKLESKVTVWTLAMLCLCWFHRTSISQSKTSVPTSYPGRLHTTSVVYWLVIPTVSLTPPISSYLFLRLHRSGKPLNWAFGVVNTKSFIVLQMRGQVFFLLEKWSLFQTCSSLGEAPWVTGTKGSDTRPLLSGFEVLQSCQYFHPGVY